MSEKDSVAIEVLRTEGSGPGAEPVFRINMSTTWRLESGRTEVDPKSIVILPVPGGGHTISARLEVPLHIEGRFLVASVDHYFVDKVTMIGDISNASLGDDIGLEELAKEALSFDSTRYNIMRAMAEKVKGLDESNSKLTLILAKEYHVEQQESGTTRFSVNKYGRLLVLHVSIGIFTTAEI